MRFIPIIVMLLAGCSWQQPVYQSSEADRPQQSRASTPFAGGNGLADSRAVIAASVAQQQLGVDYRYGGAAPSGFDCSGLVHYAYSQAGLDVPRTTDGLWRYAQDIGDSQPLPGDVLFFSFGGKPSHVGIYVGDQYFVHAPSTGKTVTTAQLTDNFYAGRLRRIGRLVR